MQSKKKVCNGCKLETYIWKKQGSERYCKSCWSCHSGKDTKPTKQKPLAARSSKKEKLDMAYSILKRHWMKEHPFCQATLPGCSIEAHDIHHKNGRVGSLYLDARDFMSVCRSCHTKIHDNPKLAKELGFYHIERKEDETDG
jgi:hypothetical protein